MQDLCEKLNRLVDRFDSPMHMPTTTFCSELSPAEDVQHRDGEKNSCIPKEEVLPCRRTKKTRRKGAPLVGWQGAHAAIAHQVLLAEVGNPTAVTPDTGGVASQAVPNILPGRTALQVSLCVLSNSNLNS